MHQIPMTLFRFTWVLSFLRPFSVSGAYQVKQRIFGKSLFDLNWQLFDVPSSTPYVNLNSSKQ